MHPEIHRELQRERHAQLLREARSGRLAVAIAESRRADRRAWLPTLRRERIAAKPAASAQ